MFLEAETMEQQRNNDFNNDHHDYGNAWNVLIASFIVNIGFGLAIPLFTSLGDTYTNLGNLGFIKMDIGLTIGILLSSFMVARMITSYLVPDLTDSAGRKNILIGGLIFYGIATFLIGFQSDFWSLLILRALEGGSVGVAFPISEALMVDSVPQSKRGEWMAKFFIMFNAGFAIGPFLGSLFYSIAQNQLGWSTYESFILPYALTGSLGFLSAIIIHFCVHDIYKPLKTHDIDSAERQKEYIRAKEYKVPFMKRLYSINLINGFALGLLSPIFTLYAENEFKVSIDNIGYIFLFAGLGGLPINWISGKLADKYNRVKLAMIGMFFGALSFIGIGVYTTLLFVMFFFITRFMSQMFFMPSFRSFQADLIPPIVRGRYFGRIQSIFNLGSAAAPIIGGFLYDYLTGSYFDAFGIHMYSSGLIFLFCALASFTSCLIIFLVSRKYIPEIHSYKNVVFSSYSSKNVSEPKYTFD